MPLLQDGVQEIILLSVQIQCAITGKVQYFNFLSKYYVLIILTATLTIRRDTLITFLLISYQLVLTPEMLGTTTL